MSDKCSHQGFIIIGVARRKAAPVLGPPFDIVEWLERCRLCGAVLVRNTLGDFYDDLKRAMEDDSAQKEEVE